MENINIKYWVTRRSRKVNVIGESEIEGASI